MPASPSPVSSRPAELAPLPSGTARRRRGAIRLAEWSATSPLAGASSAHADLDRVCAMRRATTSGGWAGYLLASSGLGGSLPPSKCREDDAVASLSLHLQERPVSRTAWLSTGLVRSVGIPTSRSWGLKSRQRHSSHPTPLSPPQRTLQRTSEPAMQRCRCNRDSRSVSALPGHLVMPVGGGIESTYAWSRVRVGLRQGAVQTVVRAACVDWSRDVVVQVRVRGSWCSERVSHLMNS